jgi:hypothetical protein
MKINRGVFIEAKRMARVDLSGKDVSTTVEGSADGVMRKKGVELAPPAEHVPEKKQGG